MDQSNTRSAFVTMKKYFWPLLVAGLFVLATYGYWRYSERELRHFKIVFLNIGQGDSTLIQFRDGTHMLIDCGPDSTVLSRLGSELPWYVRTIDTLLITHPDSDHYAGCIDVLRRYQVRKIVTNGQTKTDAQYVTFVQTLEQEEGSRAFVWQSPERISIAGTVLEFFSPDPRLDFRLALDDTNNRSSVFRLRDEPTGQSVFFAADMEEPLEQALLHQYCAIALPITSQNKKQFQAPCPALTARVLKVGHHGSQTSSGNDFIAAVAPQKAVISVGAHNTFGHPSLRVLRRLERAGITILRTDKLGDIVVN